MNIHILNTQHYLKYKKCIGSFWSLYLLGLKSIVDIKYTILILIINMILGLISMYLYNQLFMDIDTITKPMLITTIIICNLDNPFLKFVKFLFNQKSNKERYIISENIVNWMLYVFNISSHKWRRDNPDNVQREAIENIFGTYMNITMDIGFILVSLINSISFLFIAFYNSPKIVIVIIIGSIIIYKIREQFNEKLEIANSQINNDCKQIRLTNSNRYTNRVECSINPQMKKLMNPTQYNPVYGHIEIIKKWNSHNYLSLSLRLINEIFKALFIIILSLYVLDNQKMILWILVNGTKLFGLTDIVSQIDDIKNLSSSRMIQYIKMIDELELETIIGKYNKNIDEESSLLEHIDDTDYIIVPKINFIHTIEIGQIDWKLTDQLHLKSMTPIKINIDKKGIILLNGDKGCGKSLTMDILAGQYDGNVCHNSMKINGIHTYDEFKSSELSETRMYVHQLASDIYRRNNCNSLVMTLKELFPGATFSEIKDFLTHFDMTKKIHELSDKPEPLEIILGKNERSFSPGELQAMILASYLYKAIKLDTKFLLLDEPERNIDYNTVKKIFDNVICNFNGVIIMITHNDMLKQYLKDKEIIRQVWQFESIENNLMFRTNNV
jgi:ABC-type multidrug transport system fused ATPase/permease subunit